MTIIQYQNIPQKDTRILSQCNSLDANLDSAGFQNQKKKNRISRPKAGEKCSRRDAGRECCAVCETNNPHASKDNSARGGGKEQHNRVGQSRGVGTGAPQGSVLAPVPYTIYTADLPTNIETEVATLTDDTAIMALDQNAVTALQKLQAHLS
jgi:hypothetical protein